MLWTVGYTPAFCGTAADWSFTGGTTASSLNPSFEFRGAGNYTITLRLTNPCGSFTTTRTVAVKRPPQVTLNAVPNACGPVTIRPAATIFNCGENAPTYRWTFQGGIPATATTADPGEVIFTGAGTKTITLEVTNECGTTTQSRQFLISEIPQLTIPASASFCTGVSAGPFTFTSTTPGATISWTATNTAIGLASASGNGNIPAFTTTNTGATPISSVIRVTAVSAGCTQQSEFTILVNPRPAAPVVTTPINYCKDATAVPLTANAGGNELRWYTTATGGTASLTAPTPSTATVGTTNYFVSQANLQTGCEGPRSTIAVIVNAIPVISGSNAINPTACATATGTINLTGLLPNTLYQVSYQRNGVVQNASLTSNSAGVISITGLSSGTYTAIRVTLNGCPSAEAGPFTLTDPNPPATPTVSNNGPLCSGATLQLNAATTTTGTVTYAWTGPGGFTSSLQNPTIPAATVAMSGSYFVTATLNSCTSAPAQVNVVINPTPGLPTLSSNGPICAGTNLTLTANSTFTGPLTYAWTGPNGFTSTEQNPVIANAGVTAGGTYNLLITSTLGNCPAPAASITTVVNALPNISRGTISSPQTCTSASGTITLEGLVAGSTYAVRYLRNAVAQSANITAGANGTVIITQFKFRDLFGYYSVAQ